MLTARSCCGATSPGSGSLRTWAPTGTRTVGLPPKVTCRLVPGTTSAPDWRTPTDTCPNVTAWLPKTLDSVSRNPLPPMLVWMMSRTVWSVMVALVRSVLAAQVPSWVVDAPADAVDALLVPTPRPATAANAAPAASQRRAADRCAWGILRMRGRPPRSDVAAPSADRTPVWDPGSLPDARPDQPGGRYPERLRLVMALLITGGKRSCVER